MKIALAQINPTVGDIAGNTRKIVDFISRARAGGAEVVVFPELAVTGYPPRDLLLKAGFVADNLAAVREIARGVRGIDVILGYAEVNASPVGRPLYNAAAVLRDGRIASRHYKTLLPTYDVFDEGRYFEPGPAAQRNQLVRLGRGEDSRELGVESPEGGDSRELGVESPEGRNGREPTVDSPDGGNASLSADIASTSASSTLDSRISTLNFPPSSTLDCPPVLAGLSICEDLWNDQRLIGRRLYHQNPIADLDRAGAQVMINCSASPFAAGKQAFRVELFGRQARQFGKPLVYVNQVGGNDELVFDGNSMVFDGDGRVIARARAFEEDLVIVDLPDVGRGEDKSYRGNAAGGEGVGGEIDRREVGGGKVDGGEVDGAGSGRVGARRRGMGGTGAEGGTWEEEKLEAIHRALVLGLRDYVAKCGFSGVVLGLSGGIDSALTAAVAVEALGPGRVTGVAMPSRYSSGHSVADAQKLAENLGIAFQVVPIGPAHAAFEGMLSQPFEGKENDVTEENLQARCRGVTLMAFSNKFGHLLLTTGNKSELAVGYCTLYGDMCGGLAVISDVPKTVVYALSKRINQVAGREVIPQNTIDKPPSAELKPGQVDQDSLPPYEVLDAILQQYVEEDRSVGEIIAGGFDEALVRRIIRLVDRTEYKRRQAAPGLKVTSRAFGVGRRMPIAQNYQDVRRIDLSEA